MAKGDCFVVTGSAAVRLDPESGDVLIVHGLPIGTGPENHGVRFWHAWIEMRTDRGWMVVDESNDQHLVMKRAEYYRRGRIHGDRHVWRYSIREACRNMVMVGTYGPWVEGWETMEGPTVRPVDSVRTKA